MSINLKQQIKLAQQLTMTPQLQQAIKILQLPRLELAQYLREQMAENPVLEEAEYGPEEPLSKIEKNTEEMMRERLSEVGKGEQELDWEVMARQRESLNNQLSSRQQSSSSLAKKSSEEMNYENVIRSNPSLSEHLRSQLPWADWSHSKQQIAEEIIGNLSEKGYLEEAPQELAGRLKKSLQEVESMLKIIQSCDPPGVAARDLMECLKIQMHEWKVHNPHLIDILSSDIKAIQRRNYKKIAKELNITTAQVDEAMALLSKLEPIPARAFIQVPSPYITVDVVVVYVSGEWRIISHEDGLPQLKISPYYRSLIKSQTLSKKDKKQERTYLKDKLSSASWLLKSLRQRQSTIVKVSEAIVRRQKDFFEKGTHYLRPMVLKDVAQEIEVHESTVSRVSTGKYMQTPRGIFELRYFFNSSLSTQSPDHDGSIASESVKQMIEKIFQQEDPYRPLSDQAVAEMMQLKGITIARRTVAKYRKELKIGSSSERKRFDPEKNSA